MRDRIPTVTGERVMGAAASTDEQPVIATFKNNSLRLWREQYKARQEGDQAERQLMENVRASLGMVTVTTERKARVRLRRAR